MDNFKKLLNKIRDEKIQPRPRWEFQLQEFGRWGAYILFLFLGCLSFSVILYAVSESDFDLLSHLAHSRVEFFLVAFPFFWLLTLSIFLIVAIWSFNSTSKAYKQPLIKWMGLNTALSICLGTLLFMGGGGRWIEHKFGNAIASYQSIYEKKVNIWSQPQLGLLSGKIISYNDEQIQILDFNNNKWLIEINQAHIAPSVTLAEGKLIKIKGVKLIDNHFKAQNIKPWGGNPGSCEDASK